MICPRPLSEGPFDYAPTCAPDGSAVAYVSGAGSGAAVGRIVVRAAEAGAPPRVLGPGEQPVFSPDGDWIVYVAPAGRERRLARVRRDGSGRVAIGPRAREESSPAVSPDGRLVLYVARDDEQHKRLYVRRFDGSGDRVLLVSGGGLYPAW